MPGPLLNIFKYLLIVLIWLFFLRVLRAVWVESRGGSNSSSMVVATSPQQSQAPKAASSKKRSSSKVASSVNQTPRLVVVSGVSPGPGETFSINGALTIGRGQGCGISLAKDTFASSVHARVFTNATDLYVEDLDSTNGTFVNGKKVAGTQVIVSGDRLQVGQTIFEVSV